MTLELAAPENVPAVPGRTSFDDPASYCEPDFVVHGVAFVAHSFWRPVDAKFVVDETVGQLWPNAGPETAKVASVAANKETRR